MVRLPHLRMIIDPQPNSGAWNMAVDEALLQSAIDAGVATLRWYRWSEPTVSLGYFQRAEDLANDSRLTHLPKVRRLSGGGALVHDGELTYSLCLPATQRIVDHPVALYEVVHRAFIAVMQSRGVALEFRGVTTKQINEPLLCFSRGDENDLIFRGHKVLGSAQRRRRGAILQHGGFLLYASPVTPELPGIGDLAKNTDLTALDSAIGAIIAEEIADLLGIGTLTALEREATVRFENCGR